ncbi:hypothetical protein NLJ89_g8617 [Agrocybe chaxingu]|uniref:Uncharacterized protein n=1 Tax=Agrocybe chaxingu TaxID=84603 RepID=A0A9W8MS01_9AGAR|nr:hypothetical protein NLJ89_g8617 [Agrocybe chaxingu]
MGKSAKLHKRVPKKLKSSSSAPSNPSTTTTSSQTHAAQAAKKRSTLKGQTSRISSGDGLLGGADYVSLLMGGRRKARQEAQKLPQDEP